MSAAPATSSPESALAERDREILEFERAYWKVPGSKESAIRERFSMSSTQYYQILNALLETPEALAFDPLLVKRLLRLRSARQRTRRSQHA